MTWRCDHGSRGRRGERSSSPATDRGLASRLYIAALAIKSGGRKSDVDFTFTGDDVYMGDYLRSELLNRISGAEAPFESFTPLSRMTGRYRTMA